MILNAMSYPFNNSMMTMTANLYLLYILLYEFIDFRLLQEEKMQNRKQKPQFKSAETQTQLKTEQSYIYVNIKKTLVQVSKT